MSIAPERPILRGEQVWLRPIEPSDLEETSLEEADLAFEVEPAVARFEPELVLVSCGFDAADGKNAPRLLELPPAAFAAVAGIRIVNQ